MKSLTQGIYTFLIFNVTLYQGKGNQYLNVCKVVYYTPVLKVKYNIDKDRVFQNGKSEDPVVNTYLQMAVK